MKVLVATTHRRIVGGVETYLHAVLKALRTAEVEIALYTDYDADDLRIDSDAQGIVHFADWQAALAWTPDVVYLHGLASTENEEEIAARVPSVMYLHNYAGLCISGSKCFSRPDAEPCTRSFGPGCLVRYLPRGCGGRNPLTMLKLYRKNRRAQAAMPQYARVLVASRHMRKEAIRNGADPARTELLPYFHTQGVPDPQPPEPRPLQNRLLFAGRITAMKGWRPLVESIVIANRELSRSMHLTVAGEGEDRLAFEKATANAGIQATFTGWQSKHAVRTAMTAADLLLVPSLWPEPFGLVGIEAGCCGLPAVAYDVGGVPDWLAPGISGEIAPGAKPDANGFAAAIVRALRDPAHWQLLRVGAWTMAQQFTLERHMASLLEILRATAQNRQAA